MRIHKFFIVPILLLLIAGCKQEKENLADYNSSGNVNAKNDTVYIPLGAEWGGYSNPSAILIGKEPFIYVCDKGSNRIVMLNTAGSLLGALSIPAPSAITQDYKLNLIVCGEFDTTIAGVKTSFSAVYKIDLHAAGHIIANAPVTRLLPKTSSDFAHALNTSSERRYTAVSAFYDNSFFVARTGPNNTSVYDPDNSILRYEPLEQFTGAAGDTLIGRVPDIDALSTGLISAYGINCMTPFNKQNYDFIATYSTETSFKAQWFQHYTSAVEDKYISKFRPGSEAVAFVTPNKFGSPSGSCLDTYGNIFIADAGKDSVYKFSSFGNELQSFGGPKVFGRPVGVAYFDKTLYVLDAGKNAILRFILSTDTK